MTQATNTHNPSNAEAFFRYTPNRQNRRAAKENIKKLINSGSPSEKLSLTTINVLEGLIRGYGNSLSPEHYQALLEVSNLYSKILFGQTSGRLVVSLDCGLGKTLSVVALATAITKLGLKTKSVMICQSRISELCLLNDALIEAGVPPESIGLVHAYQYDQKLQVVAGEPLTDLGDVKKGYAAKPANAKENSSQFQFLLVSHSKIKSKRDIVQHTQFKGQPRSLTIWDESFVSTEATCVGLRDLRVAIVEYEGFKQHDLETVDPFISWLKKSHDVLANEEKAQQAGCKAQAIYLPPLTDAESQLYEGFAQYKPRDKRSEWRMMLREMVAMAADPVRVSMTGNEAAIQFSDAVSKELTNLVVLDASYRIRELVRIDPSLREPSFFVHRQNLKSYEDCTLQRLNYFGSRIAAETPLRAVKVAHEVATVIKGLPQDEAICLFTFKHHHSPKTKSHYSIIINALQKQGIDLDATITLKDGTTRSRFMWKTWGQETGSNNASHCKHVFLVGVLRQPENQFLAQLIGQSQNLLRDVSKASLSDAVVTELAHLIYQASLRSRARIVDNGKALAANFYLVLDEPRVEKYLSEIMSGLVIKEWIPTDPTLVKKEVTTSATQRIVAALIELTNGDLNEISVKNFKITFELTDIPDKVFRVSREKAFNINQGWKQPQGSKSLKRVFIAYNFD
jgi:hypothetical protein